MWRSSHPPLRKGMRTRQIVLAARPSFAKAFHEAPRTQAGSAAPGGAEVVAAPRGRMLPLARASGALRLPALHRGFFAQAAGRLGLKTALAPTAGLSQPTVSFQARF